MGETPPPTSRPGRPASLSAAVHELTNVLSAIAGFAELLLEARPAGDPDRARLEQIRAAAERGFAVVRTLRSQPAGKASIAGPQPPRPRRRPSREEGITILVVDDSPSIRRLVADALELAGYRVVERASPAAALAAATAPGRIDLLLTDVRMPGLSGPELARRVVERRPGLPVLFMTSRPAEAFERGADRAADVLGKPFTLEDLLARLRVALERAGRGAAKSSS